MDHPPQVAVVTGASSGIGAATTRRLAAAGATVVAVARRADRLEQLRGEWPAVEPYPGDVARRSDMAALAAHVRARHGRLDLLVNNAGVPGGRFSGPDDLDRVVRTMQVNFMGTVHTMAVFHRLLADSAPSQVVNVASVAGKVGTGAADYAASKFAVVGFSEAIGPSWAREGITVTQLNPGLIATEGLPQTRVADSPFGRLVGTPDMVADAVVDAVRRRARERTVPRWYRPLVLLRHLAPPAFWRLAARTRRAQGVR